MSAHSLLPPSIDRLRGSFIGGTFRSTGVDLDVIDPASGEELARLGSATPAECLEAVDAAAEAAHLWAATSPRERARILRRASEALLERSDEFATLITRENGKVLAEARAEVRYAADFLEWFSGEAVRVGGEFRTAPDGDKQIIVLPKPVGVALLITPWNFPAAMVTRKLGPALAAGCTVVVKPATETPLTALAIAELFTNVGLPPGVLNVVVPTPPGPAVSQMLNHEAVRKISFTGSTAVGGELLRQAAPRALRSSMELGGNAPFIVTARASIDTAVEAAMVAKFRNGGASCVAANRFYVHDSVADHFVSEFAARIRCLQVGPGMDESSEVGPLISAAEGEKVRRTVQLAIDEGAVATAADVDFRSGPWCPPTLLEGVQLDSSITKAEVFGPVAPIVRYSDSDDIVALANSSESGLAAYVIDEDAGAALRLASCLEAGMVGINRGAISDPAAPFGGQKSSGLGKEGGFEGIEEYLERTYIAIEL
ncbi:MAG: NAD-dependent succinate-semialdehyde dehydrogenase [Microthrixaceae bacterium]